MLDSAALQAWRHRAQREGGERRGPPLRKALVLVGAGVLAFALLGGHGVKGEQGTAATEPPVTTPASRCPAVGSALRADVDGDGCDDEIEFADGVLTAGSLRMRVGAIGDQVAVGRWTCGTATVALLRPATGEVFRFDGWATQGAAVSAIALGRVEGAVGVRAAARDGGRCDDLAVTRDAGPPVLLPERPVAG
jgi:hypothetical protein